MGIETAIFLLKTHLRKKVSTPKIDDFWADFLGEGGGVWGLTTDGRTGADTIIKGLRDLVLDKLSKIIVGPD